MTFRINTRTTRALGFWLVATASVGACAPSVDNITIRAPGPVTADPQVATVVIVQPASDLRSVNIIDGHGRLIGQLDERSHTVVRASEGPTILYAVLDNKAQTADRIEGTLIAGRVYYATVGAREGGVSFLTLNPRSPDGRWGRRVAYLAATPRVQLDPQKVVRAANAIGDTFPIMEAGDAYVGKLDAAHAAEHEIQESDGS